MSRAEGHPEEMLRRMAQRLEVVATEQVALQDAGGRVLAEAVRSDRDSPACDVSAMDGYAVRLADLRRGEVRVAGEVLIGQAPPGLPEGAALRIMTGGPVPAGAEVVIKREAVEEHPHRIVLRAGSEPPVPGQSIRRRGENLAAGEVVLEPGVVLTPPRIGALATFGFPWVRAYRRVRVGIITTGNELLEPDATAQPWQIRDSNGPALSAMFGACPWMEIVDQMRTQDRPEELRRALDALLERVDAVLLTGGVSMGDYDYVPSVVREAGAEVVFHKLPIRPGRPMLGAIGPRGQAVFGLPGNPVSVLVTARRFAMIGLKRRSGVVDAGTPRQLRIDRSDGHALGLWWYRLVKDGELMPTRGSGDIVSAARSEGFVEIPPDTDAAGSWPYFSWNITAEGA
jgi:molybdopterin molybdotransferase